MVAVEVAPAPSPGARELAALLRACSRALPVGSCEAAATLADRADLETAAKARVSWDEDGNASVNVRLEGSERDLSRDLSFAADDRTVERWRSVGLAIATIVDELQVQRENEQAKAVSTSAADRESEPATQTGRASEQRGRESAALASEPAATATPAKDGGTTGGSPAAPLRGSNSFDVGALVATGLAAGTPRSGIYARAAHDLSRLPAFAQVRLTYALLTSSSEPSVTWNELALGGGAFLATSAFRVEAEASLQLVRTSASAPAPDDGAVDHADSWLPGATVSGRIAWPSRSQLSGVAGVQAGWVMREVLVTNAGAELGSVPAYSVGVFAGARLVL